MYTLHNENIRYTMALTRIPNVGDIIAKRLIALYGSAEAVFKDRGKRLEHVEGIGSAIGSRILKHLLDDSLLKQVEAELNFIKTNNIRILYFMDDDYPQYLKHCIDSPVLVFCRGNINLNKKHIISIVGTRNITPNGAAFCDKLLSELVDYNPVIVSGYAYGVDIKAHKTAIDMGLQTLACLAHGLNQTYPPAHKIYNQKVEANGGFITDFWSTDGIAQGHFLSRNRIIAGLSEATIIVESAKKGGALVTANIANSYNREVFAVPGRATDKYSEGCNDLIKKYGAHLITEAKDVVELLNWDVQKKTKTTVQKALFVTLTEDEQKIYSYLQKSGKTSLDIMAIDIQIPVYTLSSILLEMELKGVIRPLAGKVFEACL